ncbi:NPC intracellular cholesterol transporter 2 [Venturia canescens]|uniref:NPC intracellular cholesterol transporter 2 n=1 Tax=Venturia canescens TaxID=32260 RepID=UPI001C9D53D8|nr:NPC intracellular cholesterol transporter 2 [Venturia canescens]
MIASRAFLLAVFCIASTAATHFSPCAEGKEPVALRVEGCEDEPCNFYRGESVKAQWDFSVVKNTANLKPQVMVTAAGFTLPYELPEQNACKSLVNGYCPLDEGEVVTYGLEMPVQQAYPKLGLLLQFSLVDDSGNVHVCFKLSAQVVDR